MKFKIATTATMFSLLLVPLAHAQVSEGLLGNIPFQFQIGETVIPAGNYVVTRTSNSQSILSVRSLDRKTAAIMFAASPELTTKSAQSTRLVFHRYGSTYFLTQVWQGFGRNGNALLESKAERAIANQMAALPTHRNVELASVLFHLQVR